MEQVITEVQNKPNRKYVDITFWLAHILIIGAFFAGPIDEQSKALQLPIALFSAGAIIGLGYYLAVATYAKKFGKSPIVWGLGSMLFSPISIWVSYIASFFIKAEIAK